MSGLIGNSPQDTERRIAQSKTSGCQLMTTSNWEGKRVAYIQRGMKFQEQVRDAAEGLGTTIDGIDGLLIDLRMDYQTLKGSAPAIQNAFSKQFELIIIRVEWVKKYVFHRTQFAEYNKHFLYVIDIVFFPNNANRPIQVNSTGDPKSVEDIIKTEVDHKIEPVEENGAGLIRLTAEVCEKLKKEPADIQKSFAEYYQRRLALLISDKKLLLLLKEFGVLDLLVKQGLEGGRTIETRIKKLIQDCADLEKDVDAKSNESEFKKLRKKALDLLENDCPFMNCSSLRDDDASPLWSTTSFF